MSKIVSMSTGAIDPIAQSKRVFFRPSTTGDVLKVGNAVCYNYDIVGDHKERAGTTRPPTDEHLGGSGTAYAEGAQTYTGRLFIVEKPDDNNRQHLAGIVKCLGPKAGADGDMIEIWVPNGAVIPVYSDAICVKGQTILALESGTYNVTTAGYGPPIGIAMESVDRNAVNGLVWAKISSTMFMMSGSYNLPLIVGTDADTACLMHHIFVESSQAAGDFVLLNIKGTLKGATGDMGSGLVKIRGDMQTTMSGSLRGVSTGLTLNTGFVEGGVFNAVLHATIGSSGTPDLTTLYISALLAEYHVDESTSVGGVPSMVNVITVHAGTYNFDYLLHIYNAGDCGDAVVTTADVTSQDSAGDKVIPIMIGPDNPANVYYLRAFAQA